MDPLKEFSEKMKTKNLRGLWESVQGDAYREPLSSFEPYVWKWEDVHGAIREAGDLIPLESAFRRVVQLCHPSLKGRTTHTLQLNIQLLKPKEHALAHRHTLAAIRFVIQGGGARCVVAGESFEIGEGDFITTPNWTWHDHVNNSNETLMWLDGLDGPLARFLEVGFWEPYKGKRQPITRSEGHSHSELSPVRPSWVRPSSCQPPPYHYPWQETEKALKYAGEMPGDPFDGVLLHYVNPLTGGPTVPTFMCGVQMLRRGETTKAHRHTSSTICHVFRGRGSTVIDGRRYEWETGDSFVVPLWRFHHHENKSDKEAILFFMTDKPVMDALGFYREESEQGR